MLSFPTPTWTEPQSPTVRKSPSAGRAASEILPRLYLSDYYTARNQETLVRLGVTHVITLLEADREVIIEEDMIEEGNRMKIQIADRADVDILSWLEQTTEFITKALKEDTKNVVLVSTSLPSHCLHLTSLF